MKKKRDSLLPLSALTGMPQRQLNAIGARLIWRNITKITTDRKPFAIAAIRLQTFY